MTWLVPLLAALLLALTLLPLSGSHAWWVRMWDFPRLQLAAGLAVVFVMGLVWLEGPLRWAVEGAVAMGLLYHLHRIRPYTPLARREMRFAPRRDDAHEVALLACNVLMENTRHDRVAALIGREDPDVLFLMETDDTWAEGLRETLARYPTVLAEARPDCYGLIFATRLPVEEARIVHLTPDTTPAVFASLRTKGGRPFHFLGLHPQPPVPGVDTDERDAQVLYAARFARRTDIPVVVMGDFNDAAWSHTSRLYKTYGRYLDPRVGRGLYASFHADNILIRCALDQLFVSEEMAMIDFRLGPKVGSDHFPVIARLRVDPEEAARLNRRPDPLEGEELEEIERRMADYRRKLEDGHEPAIPEVAERAARSVAEG
jgi:endonuclease/exonuclease/phosphatase (EEP) superfamily protein YafD